MSIYFGEDDDQLSAEARRLLDHAAVLMLRFPTSGYVLGGHTDSSGSDAYNLALSRRRAARVRDYLVRRGIPASLITIKAYGETEPAIDTRDGEKEPENRRVIFERGAAGSR